MNPHAVAERDYRRVLGHFATGVAVVTSMTAAGPAGLAVGSFAAVSLEPPLVSFCVQHTSMSWPEMRAARSFCVNILREDQQPVCRRFATSGGNKFRGLSWHPAPTGSPILTGVLAWLDCELEAEHDAGDHTIVLGRVLELHADATGRPLVFFRGRFEGLAR